MKADFDSIYTAPDPRPYFRELAPLDYQIPAHAGRLFGRLADHLHDRGRPTVRVADLCCSYGLNAMLMKHRRGFDEIVAHYTDPAVAALGDEEMAELDRSYYAASAAAAPWIEVVGMDVAEPAVEYAERVGIVDVGLAVDLETPDVGSDAMDATVADALRDVSIVTVSGGIGYVTERTTGRVLDAARPDAWFAALCLRWVDARPVVADLERRGLVVERLEGTTFRQRKYANDDERAFARSEAERLGVEPPPDDGYHHTDLYLGRPADEADPPLRDLLTPDP